METLATVFPRALLLPPPLALQLARELGTHLPPVRLTRHLTVVPRKYLMVGTGSLLLPVLPGEVGAAAAVQPADQPVESAVSLLVALV